MEILVCDNHSSDESIGWIRNIFGKNPRVKILETRENSGYGQGNNFAIRRAEGTFLLIVNPDNTLEKDAAEKMVRAMERDQSIGILSPKLVHPDGTIRDSARSFPTLTDLFIKRTTLKNIFSKRMRKYLQHDEDPTRVRETDWVAGACFVMRKDLYEKLGGFDKRFFLFFEDTDLCRRVWQAGKKVMYFPVAEAKDQKKRLSEGGLLSILWKKTMRIHLVSGVRYFMKWRGMGA